MMEHYCHAAAASARLLLLPALRAPRNTNQRSKKWRKKVH
jgi:hypothetical protein